MKTSRFVLAVTLGVLCAVGTWAGTQAGKSELRLDGVFQNMKQDDNNISQLSAQIVYNKFISDQLSLGVAIRPSVQKSDQNNDDSTASYVFFLGRGDFYLNTGDSSFVPYIGAHAGVINYKVDADNYNSSETVFTYGGQGGGKYFVSENTSFNVELDVSIYKPDEKKSSDSEDIVATSVLFGYSVYF